MVQRYIIILKNKINISKNNILLLKNDFAIKFMNAWV